MKTRTFIFAVAAALTGMLAFSGSGFAAKGGIPGPPTNGGGGAPDLGDLIVLHRDAWGRPIPTDATIVDDPETGLPVPAGLCQQPIGLPSDSCPLAEVCVNPEEPCLVPVDPYSCGVMEGYETCTQEVDFGRTSVIRAPDTVLEQSLGEAVTKLATAGCTTLDPAGRLVNTSEIDDEVFSATIDSPLENLAIYWQLMLTGYLGTETNQIDLPGDNVLTTAARGLGAAADKTGKVTVDQVVYSNEILGLLDVPTYLPKVCVTVREEVQGNMEEVQKCVLDYSAYSYTRADNFGALPAPPYIPEEDGGTIPLDGWFEYLGVVDADENPVLFQIIQGLIMDSVFCLDSEGAPVVPEDGDCVNDNYDLFDGGNVGGFTQAADDTREVIEFTHDRPLPLGYETKVPMCDDPNTGLIYDVSISEESGLQVPKNIVDGSSDREFIVTVANAGPSDATVTLRVTALSDAGGTVLADLVGDDAGFIESPFEFEPIVIPAGQNRVFSGFISVDIGQRATIDWEATASTDCELCDTNDNSTRTAISNVKVTGSGGGVGGGRGR